MSITRPLSTNNRYWNRHMTVIVPSISGLVRVDWLSRRSLVGFGAGPRDCEASLGLGAATSNIDVDATSLVLGAAARDIDSISLRFGAATYIQSVSFFTLAARDIDSISLVGLRADARDIQTVYFFTLAAKDIGSISLVALTARDTRNLDILNLIALGQTSSRIQSHLVAF
jgi:hypothetical protein